MESSCGKLAKSSSKILMATELQASLSFDNKDKATDTKQQYEIYHFIIFQNAGGWKSIKDASRDKR